MFCSDVLSGDGPYDGWTCVGAAWPLHLSHPILAFRRPTRRDYRSRCPAESSYLHVARVRAVFLAEVEDQRLRPSR